MPEITMNADLVAYCGLYCGACKSYLNEKCPGCHENTKATWCSVRSCNMEKSIHSCAECTEFPDPRDCKKFNNVFSKLFGLILHSDRAACIAQIKELGLEGHATIMTEKKTQTIRR